MLKKEIANASIVGHTLRIRDLLAPSVHVSGLRIERLSSLILLGVLDSLKLLADRAPVSSRQQLVRNPRELADQYTKYLIPGAQYLLDLCDRLPTQAKEEFGRTVVDWTAYLAVEVELGRPFLFQVEETLDVPRRRRLLFRGWTTHAYPLALRDCPSTHVEVCCEDNELEIARSLAVGVRIGDARYTPEDLFGDQSVSRQTIHFYTSRRVREHPDLDLDGAELLVRFRVAPAIRRGYIMAVIAVGVAVGWVSWEWIRPALKYRNAPSHEDTLLLVSAAFASFLLWLTGTQHKKALVHEKLRTFRWFITFALLLPIVAAGVALAIRGNYLDFIVGHKERRPPYSQLLLPHE